MYQADTERRAVFYPALYPALLPALTDELPCCLMAHDRAMPPLAAMAAGVGQGDGAVAAAEPSCG